MKAKNLLGQVSDFDLRLLRLFKTVAECGSFTAAEGALGITRSAVSLQMSDLEKRLGMRLCQRGRAGFALTDEGREVLRATDVLLAAVENFRGEVNQINQTLKGELNIGVVNNLVTMPHMRVTQALRKLHEKSSEIRINISMSTHGEIERGLIDGRLQVGVLPMNNMLSALEYSFIYQERSQLYCSQAHPLFGNSREPTEEELRDTNAVIPSYRMTAEAIDLHQLLTCSATASDREGIAFLILTGKYVGFLPSHYAENWVLHGQMQMLCPEKLYFDSKLAVATRKGRRSNLILEYFLSFL